MQAESYLLIVHSSVCSFQDIDLKGPAEQDKASKTQAEKESEDKLSDTKAARTKEVGSVCQFANHFLQLID